MSERWFRLKGDTRLNRCATDKCGGQSTWRLEAAGIGSDYCSGCKEKIDYFLNTPSEEIVSSQRDEWPDAYPSDRSPA